MTTDMQMKKRRSSTATLKFRIRRRQRWARNTITFRTLRWRYIIIYYLNFWFFRSCHASIGVRRCGWFVHDSELRNSVRWPLRGSRHSLRSVYIRDKISHVRIFLFPCRHRCTERWLERESSSPNNSIIIDCELARLPVTELWAPWMCRSDEWYARCGYGRAGGSRR